MEWFSNFQNFCFNGFSLFFGAILKRRYHLKRRMCNTIQTNELKKNTMYQFEDICIQIKGVCIRIQQISRYVIIKRIFEQFERLNLSETIFKVYNFHFDYNHENSFRYSDNANFRLFPLFPHSVFFFTEFCFNSFSGVFFVSLVCNPIQSMLKNKMCLFEENCTTTEGVKVRHRKPFKKAVMTSLEQTFQNLRKVSSQMFVKIL